MREYICFGSSFFQPVQIIKNDGFKYIAKIIWLFFEGAFYRYSFLPVFSLIPIWNHQA